MKNIRAKRKLWNSMKKDKLYKINDLIVCGLSTPETKMFLHFLKECKLVEPIRRPNHSVFWKKTKEMDFDELVVPYVTVSV